MCRRNSVRPAAGFRPYEPQRLWLWQNVLSDWWIQHGNRRGGRQQPAGWPACIPHKKSVSALCLSPQKPEETLKGCAPPHNAETETICKSQFTSGTSLRLLVRPATLREARGQTAPVPQGWPCRPGSRSDSRVSQTREYPHHAVPEPLLFFRPGAEY